MTDLKVVCWKWAPPMGYRSAFTHEQVNRLYNMVGRNYHKPFELICITDNPKHISSDIRILPLQEIEQFAHIPSPHGGLNPACYRRLWMYGEHARDVIGERFVSIDLDVVITDDVTPVWDRPEDFMIWGETLRRTPYNGSMQLMTAGARKQVYDEFDPDNSPRDARRAGFDGSDQAWISYTLSAHEPHYGKDAGIYSIRDMKGREHHLPPVACLVQFNGPVKPWSSPLRWAKEHWR